MLKIKNLSIIYGDRKILENVSIKFPQGYVSVIQGASGSGKSSLLNILGLMQKPNKECKYYKDEIEISSYKEQEKADFRLHHIGFIFQQNNLIQEFSAQVNVSIPLIILGQNKTDDSHVKEILDYVGLSHLRNKLPSSLSGGEEQRIAIARALTNDADIILADEPTASLDEENATKVLELLKKLAHELNKIVIIVSHDHHVLNIADFVYKIENKELVQTKGASVMQDKSITNNTPQATDLEKRKMFNFMQFYTKNRVGDKLLNKTFVAITAFIAALMIMFVNFGSEFANGQNAFINAISDKSIFVVNDTLGLNSETNYESALSINKNILSQINQIPNVYKWYPYYEFLSSDLFRGDQDEAEISVKDGNNIILNKQYKNNAIVTSDTEQFAVAPLYPEENLDFLLEYKSDLRDDKGIILTNGLAKQLNISPEQLIDKEIYIKAFVPTKLFDTKIIMPINSSDPNAGDKEINSDRSYKKLVTIKSRIKGILSSTYNLQRSENNNLMLLDYETFADILEKNQDKKYAKTAVGSSENELAPSSIIIFADSYENVPMIIAKLQAISPTFSISNTASDMQAIQNNISAIKNVMLMITVVFIGIVILMFGMLYYIKNRSRKKEVGILKALGLTRGNIVLLITFEMWQIAIKSFITSLMISFILAFLGNGIFGVQLFHITANSVLIGLLVSVGIVIIAGVLPIYKASKVDPIAAIKEINK